MGAQSWRQWRPVDPDLVGLRRAGRAAIIMPAAFAGAGALTHNSQVTLFAAFGCFALLVMANFGGPRRSRALAYLATALIGMALVALGTLASPLTVSAALAMLVAAFCLQFMGVFGGYAVAAQTALMLAFVLAVTIPGSPATIGPRLLGWLGASVLSTLGGLYLWPSFERNRIRIRAAAACQALAGVVAVRHGSQEKLASRWQGALEAVAGALQAYAAAPIRPASPARRDRAFVELLAELNRAAELLSPSLQRPWPGPGRQLDESEGLAEAVAATLEGSARALTDGSPPDLRLLEQARRAHRQALDHWAGQALSTGWPTSRVLDCLDAEHLLRVTSYLALALGANAVIVAGGDPLIEAGPPAGTPVRQGLRGMVFRINQTVRAHLDPSSSVLHSSIRAGVGLGLAVFVARFLQLDHAFWVVLGAISVLRSNAFATGRTTAQALLGTLSGFGVGAVFAVLAAGHKEFLWAALPVTVFLAAYAPSALGFVVGQAAFTLNIIILFNLITFGGWRVGLLRIEDVAIGAATSVVISLFLWPRGARAELKQTVARVYAESATFISCSLDRLLEGGPVLSVTSARRAAIRARDRASEALDRYLNERGRKPLAPETGAFLVASGTHMIMAGDVFNVVADAGYEARGCKPGADSLRAQSQALVNTLMRLSGRLAGQPGLDDAPGVSNEALQEAALGCLERWKKDSEGGRPAIAVVAGGEWLQELGRLAAELEEPVTAAVEAARVPWWR
jgi:uncharacterized membrane protein YccC